MLAPVGVITVAAPPRRWQSRHRGRRAAIWLGGLADDRRLLVPAQPRRTQATRCPGSKAGPLPGPDQEDLYPRPAHSIAEYLADRHAWTDFFFPGLAETLGPLWFVVLFAAFAGIVLGLRRRHSPLIRILALAAAATLIAHVFNPISASGPDGGPYGFASNLRYAAPGHRDRPDPAAALRDAVDGAAGLCPRLCAAGRGRRDRLDEWIQPQAAAGDRDRGGDRAGADLAPRQASRAAGCGRRSPRWSAIAVLAGYPQQRQYFEDRYRADVAPPLDNPGFRATSQWQLIQTWARDQHGLRIGIVGTPAAYGQYVFYGDDLSNEVRYLGEPQPHGGLTQIESCRRWRERIDDGHFNAVVITPEDPASPFPPPQIEWTATEQAAVPVLRVNPAGVFLIAGALDPTTCSQAAAKTGPPPRGSKLSTPG